MGSLSIWHWLILLGIVVMVFGTRRLRSAGSDLGSAVRSFKDALKEGEAEASAKKPEALSQHGKPLAGSEVSAASPGTASQSVV